MRLPWKRYVFLLVVLTLAPILREFVTALYANHHVPFASAWDVMHTLSESLVMLFFGCLVVVADRRFTLEKRREIRLTQAVSIEALAALAEYRDKETANHLQRIRCFVEFLTTELKNNSCYGDYLGGNENYLEDVGNAAILHDIGKIAVPDEILNKPGKLTEEEFETIKQHTVIGGAMLANADKRFKEKIGRQSYLTLAQEIALHHHEKWDGSGYPDGLCGDDIPLAARITALCDVYDAVTSDRVYKKAWSHEQAVDLIGNGRGSHFDPVITDAFMTNHAEFQALKQRYSG